MRSTLVDPRAFKCPHCSKSFHCSSHLTTHVRTHTGERPYKCGQCPKSFALLGNLTAHVRTHTGEKPYSCKYCTKSFTQSTNLNVHMRVHTGERPYKCERCQKAFKTSGALNGHVKSCYKIVRRFAGGGGGGGGPIVLRHHGGGGNPGGSSVALGGATMNAARGGCSTTATTTTAAAASGVRNAERLLASLDVMERRRRSNNNNNLLPSETSSSKSSSLASSSSAAVVSSEAAGPGSSSSPYGNISLFNYRRRKFSDIITTKKRFGGGGVGGAAAAISPCKSFNVGAVARTPVSASDPLPHHRASTENNNRPPSRVSLKTFKQETTTTTTMPPSGLATPLNGIFESRQHHNNKSRFPTRESVKDGSDVAAATAAAATAAATAAASANKLLGREMISQNQNFNIYNDVHKSNSNDAQEESSAINNLEDSKDFIVSASGFSQQPTIHSNGESVTVDFNSLMSLSEISQDKVDDVLCQRRSHRQTGVVQLGGISGITDSNSRESRSSERDFPGNSGGGRAASCSPQQVRVNDGGGGATNYVAPHRHTTPSKDNFHTGREKNNSLNARLHQRFTRPVNRSSVNHSYSAIQSPLLSNTTALSSDRPIKSLTHSSPANSANSCLAFLEVSTYTQIFRCKLCNLVFETKDDFLNHTPLHEDDELLVCKFCEMDFKTPLDLVLHQKDHILPEQFCELCDQMVLSTRFAAHLSLHATAMKQTAQETRIFWCHFCDKSFIDQSYLDLHLRVHSIREPLHFRSANHLQSNTRQRVKPLHNRDLSKSFKCPYCQKKFYYSRNLIAHMHSHSFQRLYKCQKCPRALRTVQRFNIHQKICPKTNRHHSKKAAPFGHSKTAASGKNSSRDGSSNCHLPEHSNRSTTEVHLMQNIPESIMEVSGSPDSSVVEDKQKNEECVRENLQAPRGGETIDNGLQDTEGTQSSPLGEFVEGQTPKQRDDHQIQGNSGKVLLRCLCCHANFSSKLSLSEHINARHDSGDQCRICGAPLDVHNDLAGHVDCYTTSTDVYRNCKHCSEVFPDVVAYQSHLLAIHKLRVSEEQGHDADEDMDLDPEERSSEGLLTSAANLESVPDDSGGSGPTANCIYRGEEEKRLRKRRRRPAVLPCVQVQFQPRNKCHNCGRTFSSMSQLYVHLVKAHDRLQPHRCQRCKRLFKNCTNFYTHVCGGVHVSNGGKEEEEESASYECKLCCKSFTRPDNLKTHLRTHNRYSRPFRCRCKYCSKLFSTPDNLNVHLRVHTNERPYLCHHCNSAFKTTVARNLHIRNCAVKRLKKKAVSRSLECCVLEKTPLTSPATRFQSELSNRTTDVSFVRAARDNSSATSPPMIENMEESPRLSPANENTEQQEDKLERSPTIQHILVPDHQQESHSADDDVKPKTTELCSAGSIPTIQGFYRNKFCTDNLAMSNSSKSFNYSTPSPNEDDSESKDIVIPTSEIISGGGYSGAATPEKSVNQSVGQPEEAIMSDRLDATTSKTTVVIPLLGSDPTDELDLDGDDKSYLPTTNKSRRPPVESDDGGVVFFEKRREEAETEGSSRHDPCRYKITDDLPNPDGGGGNSTTGLYTCPNSGGGAVSSLPLQEEGGEEEKLSFTVVSNPPADSVIEPPADDDRVGLESNLRRPVAEEEEDVVPSLFKCLKCFRAFGSAPEYTDHLMSHVWTSNNTNTTNNNTSGSSSPVGSQSYPASIDRFEPSNTTSSSSPPPLPPSSAPHPSLLLPPPPPPTTTTHISSSLDHHQTSSSSGGGGGLLRPGLLGPQSVLYALQQQQQQPAPDQNSRPVITAAAVVTANDDESKTQLIKCKQCPKRFTKIYSLAVHMKSHYEQQQQQQIHTQQQQQQQQIHAQQQDQQQQQQQHQQHICRICPGTEVFPTADDLNEHLKHHCEFRCKFCQKVVHSASQLYTHMRTHTGEKPFHCPHCPKTFAVNCNLIAHVRIHTGERPFRCQYCVKSFAQATNLNVHTRIHTGERPYLCSKCKRAFRTSSALKGHLKCCPVPV